MAALRVGFLVSLAAAAFATVACGSDDDDGGAGGASGASNLGGNSSSGGKGGSSGSLGSGGKAVSSGGSGQGGKSGACDTSGLDWGELECPAGSLRTFDDPTCSALYKCIIGNACAGLNCAACIDTVRVAYKENDICIEGITAQELAELCQQQAALYPGCENAGR